MAMLFERLRQDLPIIGAVQAFPKSLLRIKECVPLAPKTFSVVLAYKTDLQILSNISYFRSGEEQAIDIKTKPANPEYKLNHGGDQRVGKIGVSAHRCAMKR